MPRTPTSGERAFYDVFISYRHRDKEEIDELERRIREAGFEPFRDLNFLDLQDASNVNRPKIELIRRQLSRSTCLIFAFSRASAERAQEAGASVGVWMPWELGFFDGAISSRIGVYLLDGPRGEVEPSLYFKGSEYLQLYEELGDQNLEAFLKRNAVRERRIDNVASGFVWLEHLFRECVANPTNVSLGVLEWFSDHAARFWEEQGNPTLASAFAQMKVTLDDVRVTAVPALRLPMFDELRGATSKADLPEGATQEPVGAAHRAAPPHVTDAARGAPPVPGADLQAIQQRLMAAWKPLLTALEQAGRRQPGAEQMATRVAPPR